eukprot:scaffold293861_cov28-Tisochrysis_lutea.AAC.5
MVRQRLMRMRKSPRAEPRTTHLEHGHGALVEKKKGLAPQLQRRMCIRSIQRRQRVTPCERQRKFPAAVPLSCKRAQPLAAVSAERRALLLMRRWNSSFCAVRSCELVDAPIIAAIIAFPRLRQRRRLPFAQRCCAAALSLTSDIHATIAKTIAR